VKAPKIDNDTIKTALVIGGGLLLLSSVKSLFASSDVVPDDLVEFVKDKYHEHVDTVKASNPNAANLQFDRPVYKQIAQDQYNAMEGFGTNETILFDTLDNLNGDDLKMVFMDFGLRAPGSRVSGLWKYDRGNIFTWYNAELSGSDLEKMREVWKKSGLWK